MQIARRRRKFCQFILNMSQNFFSVGGRPVVVVMGAISEVGGGALPIFGLKGWSSPYWRTLFLDLNWPKITPKYHFWCPKWQFHHRIHHFTIK